MLVITKTQLLSNEHIDGPPRKTIYMRVKLYCYGLAGLFG